METKIVKLKSNENEIFEVPADILKKSNLISGLIEDAIEENKEISLKEVSSMDLKRIIEYLTHYKNMEPKEIPKPFPDFPDDDFFKSILNDEWTFDFLQKISLEEVVNLVNSADYLQINGLINILAAKMSFEMINCEVEEARRKFGIETDLTDEEIAEIAKYPLD
mgnify:CR=1 FL=1